MTERPPARDMLPTMLLMLTVVSGVVDAVTFLDFRHIFIANMTGNVVFLGFALAGAGGISVAGSLTAMAAFLFGAVIAGRLDTALASHRGRLFAIAVTIEAALFCIVVVCVAAWPISYNHVSEYASIVFLGIAMGVQNGVSRKLAVPDLTTSVMTMTITGIAADSSFAGGANPRILRRLAAVGALLVGAAAGTVLVLHQGVVVALAVAAAILCSATFGAWVTARGTSASVSESGRP